MKPVEVRELSMRGLANPDDVEAALDQLAKESDPKWIIAQRGGQQKMLSNMANIVIGGGSRGGSKSYSLLMMGMNYVYENNFRGIIFRKEKDDLTDIVDTSYSVFGEEGTYIENKARWMFNHGGWLAFNYHGGSAEDFKRRFQGRQYAYIGVDEITHMEYEKFKYLITCNRNPFHYENHFFGTCNPDPDCWVAKFISWWIGEDGLPIPERDGRIRYCFMDGDTVDTIYWGLKP